MVSETLVVLLIVKGTERSLLFLWFTRGNFTINRFCFSVALQLYKRELYDKKVQELIEELASPNNTSRMMAMNYAKPLYTTSTKRSQEPEQENQFVYRNGALRWSCVIFWFPKLSPSPNHSSSKSRSGKGL
ncbi:uncharacterized protein LOC111830106 isoform X5 [Capsella rubella]|uniref:uncharacterized protein LOC111830106 isoform X5 n=1 Tax=Capsella rubella TaxID=81985 RepID=UPI000CD5098D|nr:uncharacterized protein LOC111830106 isoform X5 [Capsella rubella]